MDAHVNTADDPSTSDKNLVNFAPVIPEFCGLPGGLHATRWAHHTVLVHKDSL